MRKILSNVKVNDDLTDGNSMCNSWYVYIIECKDGKFYTGVTNNLDRRIQQHNRGQGCRFTKYRIPVKLLYSEQVETRNKALSLESKIKGLTKEKKLSLIHNKQALRTDVLSVDEQFGITKFEKILVWQNKCRIYPEGKRRTLKEALRRCRLSADKK